MKILFISSKDHWRNGWLTTPSELELAIKILRKAGVEVDAKEVASVSQLEHLLSGVSSGTLLWPNAYYVQGGNNELVWLNDYIEKYQLPFIGSNAATLRQVLQKDICQSILKKRNLPIPQFTIITAANVSATEEIIVGSRLGFPMVLKPSAEAGSVGTCMVNNHSEAVAKTKQLLREFPHCNVIIEAFLPSDDVTCGHFKLGVEVLLLPTYYLVKSKTGTANILSRKERLRAWDDVDKMQPCIADQTILDQLKTYIPQMVSALNIHDVTRIDGRLDNKGQLRFFDVNGLPALDFPDGVLVKQCFSCFPNYTQEKVYSALIHTIVLSAALRHDMEMPNAFHELNLLQLESEWVMKLSDVQFAE